MNTPKQSKREYKKYTCETCDFITKDKTKYTNHLQTKKHLKLVNNEPTRKVYECDLCDVSFKIKSRYEEHLQSDKHKRYVRFNAPDSDEEEIDSDAEPDVIVKPVYPVEVICKFCGRNFKTPMNLFRHRLSSKWEEESEDFKKREATRRATNNKLTRYE